MAVRKNTTARWRAVVLVGAVTCLRGLTLREVTSGREPKQYEYCQTQGAIFELLFWLSSHDKLIKHIGHRHPSEILVGVHPGPLPG
jgi:hypothetical protein